MHDNGLPDEVLLKVNPLILEEKYKSREISLRVEAPFAIRVDGVGFHRLPRRYERPRDLRIHSSLLVAAYQVVVRYGFFGAYIVSDEANFIVLSNPPYSGRVEKLLSIVPSIVSSRMSLILGHQVLFDAKIIKLESLDEVREYILYRARVGFGNFIGSLASMMGLWREHRPVLRKQLVELREKGVDISRISVWKKLGSSIVWDKYSKRAVNRATGEEIIVSRRRARVYPGPWRLIEAVNIIGSLS